MTQEVDALLNLKHCFTTGLIAHLTEAKRVHPVLDRAPIDGAALPLGIG